MNGFFLGGLLQGAAQGMKLGQQIRTALDENEVRNVREQGLAEAKAARDAEVQAAVIEKTGLPMDKDQSVASPTSTDAKTETVTNPKIESKPLPPPSDTTPAAIGASSTPASAPSATTPASPVPEQATPTAPAAAPAAPAIAPAAAPTAAAPAPAAPATSPAASGLPGVAPTAAPAAPAAPAGNFMVGDKSFATREEALKAADAKTPSVQDYFMKNAVPKIQQKYIEQGDMAKAEAWDKYAKDKTTQKNMETWAKAYRSAQVGDMTAAADHVFELYKGFDDGITPLSKETVKDKDGNVTGFNVRTRNDTTKEETTQFIGKDQLLEMGLSALSPPAMFEQAYKRNADAQKLKAVNAAKAQEDRMKAKDTRDLEILKQQGRSTEKQADRDNAIELATIKGQLDNAKIGQKVRAEAETKIEFLKRSGYSEDQINGMVPEIIGVGSKKTTDPTERRAIVTTELAKDPLFVRKSAEDKSKAVDDVMGVIYGPGAGGATPSKRAAPAASATPAAGGLPARPGAKGVPVLDTKTGQIIYR